MVHPILEWGYQMKGGKRRPRLSPTQQQALLDYLNEFVEWYNRLYDSMESLRSIHKLPLAEMTIEVAVAGMDKASQDGLMSANRLFDALVNDEPLRITGSPAKPSDEGDEADDA